MGLLVECPECKKRNSAKAKICTGKKDGKPCGFALAKFSGRVYWIEWYQDGQRKRERIGPNKAAAEQRLREVLSARTEGRHIHKSPDTLTTFRELGKWYLNLAEVKAKKSYNRDQALIRKLEPFFGDRLLKDITPTLVEAYKQRRLGEISYRKQPTKPATVNRELACLQSIFNRAVMNQGAERNPTKGVRPLKLNNVRDRILSQDEYEHLLTHLPHYLKPVVKLAYYTGMRKGEILKLTWDHVDLREGFIHLRAEDTKTQEGRSVPLNDEMIAMLQAMPRGLPGVPVFTYQGKSIKDVKRSFKTACKNAGIENFTFHDFRHTAINNWRLAGHDYFRIMAASGHKSMMVFKRYNTVSREELKALVGRKSEPMDTNMDTGQERTLSSPR